MQVTLNIPALFTTFAEIDAGRIDGLELTALKKLLSHSKRQEVASMEYETWLYQQFTGQHCAASEIPFAGLTAEHDGLDGSAGVWMRADPVYLYPDTHSLIMQDPRHLKLTTDESSELANLVRPLLDDYAATLHTPTASRWYLHFKNESPQLACTPLYEAVMKPANTYLPSGTDGRRWLTLFNEIQMLLNQSAVNESRVQQGLQPVNSLWFWGLGRLPENPGPVFDCCIGGDEYVQALCSLTGVRHQSLMEGMTMSSYQENALVLVESLLTARRFNNPEQWLSALQQVDSEVIAPLLDGLKQADIKQLTLVSDNGHRYECTARDIKAFWKRRRPASSFLLH